MGKTGVWLIVAILAACIWTGFSAIQPEVSLGIGALCVVAVVVTASSPRVRATADRVMSSRGVQVGSGAVVAGVLIWCTGAAIALQTLSLLPSQVGVQDERAAGTTPPPARTPDNAVEPPTVSPVANSREPDGGSAEEALAAALAAAPPPTRPGALAIALDREYRAALRAQPEANAYESVARRHRLTVEFATELITNVAEYRQALLDAARDVVGRSVIGRVQANGAEPTDIGDTTLMVSLTVIGCPTVTRRDPRLDALASDALRRIAANLPEGIDSFRATIGYEGVLCAPGRMPYGATWTRASNVVSFR